MKGLAKHVAALSLGVVAFAAPLHAQMPMQFSLGGSLGIPLGDFGDAFKMGFHGLAAVAFTPASLPVSFQVDGNFAQFKVDGGGDGKARMLFATGDVVYKFNTAAESRLRPYLIGGLGLYNSKAIDGIDATDDPSSTDFGVNAGAGFNVAAGAASLFVESRFHDVFTDVNSTQFIPLTVGIRLGGK